MGLADRNYSRASGAGRSSGGGGGYRDSYSGGGGGGGGFSGGGGGGHGILSLLNWSFPVGSVAGIRIRVHITFIILVVFWILGDPDPLWKLRLIALLFGSVLLHEFGHAFACRAVGGQATDILMWPLGGLAFVNPPHRPWPEFVTVIWGPLVNFILAAAGYLILIAAYGSDLPVSLHPFHPHLGRPGNLWGDFLADLFVVNYALMMFNLALIFYPFDGGRIVQIILWTQLGYVRSMRLACTFGMFGAGLVALIGLWQQMLILVFIAVMGFVACMQQRRALQGVDDYDLGLHSSYGTSGSGGGGWRGGGGRDAARSTPGFFARLRENNRARQQQRAEATRRHQDAEVDRILDKIRREGIGTLTEPERATLNAASQSKRGER